jgi:formylglycine-generating enzyme required for sulfatase activity
LKFWFAAASALGLLLTAAHTAPLELRLETSSDGKNWENVQITPEMLDEHGRINYIGTADHAVRLRLSEGSVRPPEGFALIPAGAFIMGSPPDEPGRWIDEVQGPVTLTQSFYMAVHPVTWSLWNEVRSWALANGYSGIGTGRNGHTGNFAANHPVTEVSWWDVVLWLNARSEKEGKTPVYYTSSIPGPGNVLRSPASSVFADWGAAGYRLPTEAEWEYACRAGTTTAFYTGAILHTGSSPVDPNLDTAGWYAGNSLHTTRAVGLKQANAWGLYDMHGHVWEWVWDWWDWLDSSPAVDPTGPESGTTRILRGGGVNADARNCRSAMRALSSNPTNRTSFTGFRPVFNQSGH